VTESTGEPVLPPLGKLAVDRGMITAQQLQGALVEQSKAREAGRPIRPLGQILVARGYITAAQLSELLAAAKGETAPAASENKPNDSKDSRRATSGRPAPAPPTPTAFGKYTLLRELGHGGKGVVWEAMDTVLNRKVALKLLKAEACLDDKEREVEEQRFLVEARLSAHLPKHPHIVSVYEAGDVDAKRYLAMELIPGHPMTRWRRTATPEAQVLLIRDVALAVDHAHQNGVIHRDLKPQNILVDAEGRPHVTDFGLARMVGQKDESRNPAARVWGTPTYMSPEQARVGKAVDARSDVYSLGVMLYEVLAGHPPFRGTASEVLENVVHTPVPPLSEVVDPSLMTPLQKALEPVCVKALAKGAAERQASARELADEITSALEGGGSKKKKLFLIAGAAAAAVAIAVVTLLLATGGPKEDPEAVARKQAEARRFQQQVDAEKRRTAEAEERLRLQQEESRTREEDLKRQRDNERRANEESAALLKVEQIKAEEARRAAEERQKAAEAAAKKAEDQLKQPASAEKGIATAGKPGPSGAEAKPDPAKAPPAAEVKPEPPKPQPVPPPASGKLALIPTPPPAPTGEPKTLEDGALHFEAEDFSGGEKPVADVDYSDSSPGNNGRAYRIHDVDIALDNGIFYVFDIQPGEWLHYRFAGGGRFQLDIRYLSRDGGTVHFEIDGVNVTGPVALPPPPDRRTWGSYSTVTSAIPDGVHDLKLVFDTRLFGLDFFRLKKFTPAAVPEAAKLREAEATVREFFKAEYARKAPADQIALAKKLIDEATRNPDDAVVRFVCWTEASEAAAHGGDVALAFSAIDALDRAFAIDAMALKMASLANASKAARTTDAQRGIAEAYLELMDMAADREDYDGALALQTKAETAARNGQSAGTVARIQARAKEITAVREEFRQLKPALKTLEEKPDDAAANLAVGFYRCFARGEWARGLPLLAKGSDAPVAALAKKETPPPTDVAEQAALADGWREAGEKRTGAIKNRFLTRALHWYEKAQPGLTGLGRLKLDAQMEGIYKALGDKDSIKKGLVFWVEPGKEPLEPYRDHVSGSRAQNYGATVADSGARALSFAGRGPGGATYVEYPASDAAKSVGDIGSVFVWIKSDSYEQQFGGVVDRGESRRGPQDVDDFGLLVFRGQVVAWFHYPETRQFRYSSKGTLPANRWVFCGFAWDSKNVSFYIDGKEDSTVPITAGSLPQRRGTRIYVGSNAPGGHEEFKGFVGSVMIYNRTLSSQEAMQLYLGTRTRFNK